MRSGQWTAVAFSLVLVGATIPSLAHADPAATPKLSALVAQTASLIRRGRFRGAIRRGIKAETVANRLLKKNPLPAKPSKAHAALHAQIQALRARAIRLKSIATVRTRGDYSVRGRRVQSANEREESLRFAYVWLKRLQNKQLKTRVWLAEAMARVPIKQPEALKRLRAFAAAGQLKTSWGYGALRRMEAEHGDRKAAKRALERCRALRKLGEPCHRH